MLELPRQQAPVLGFEAIPSHSKSILMLWSSGSSSARAAGTLPLPGHVVWVNDFASGRQAMTTS